MREKIVIGKGDCHGDPSDLVAMGYKLEDMGVRLEDVIVVVAGDFGMPWPGNPADNREKLATVNRIGFDVVVVLGNHEWWGLVYSMPQGVFYKANVYQCFYDGVWYENIHYVADPTVMTVDGKDYLLVPGADSHDIRDGVITGLRPIGETETDDEWLAENGDAVKEFERSFRQENRYWPQFRVEGATWWREEAIQFDKLDEILAERDCFQAVVSHDCPDMFAYEFQLQKSLFERYPPTKAERMLEDRYRNMRFGTWLHGHFHRDARSREDPRVVISYFVPHVLSGNFCLTADDKYDMISSESDYWYR